MGFLSILAYIFLMYVRPQDWMASLYGFPLVDIVACAALVISMFSLLQDKRAILIPQAGFMLLFLAMVFLSNFANRNGLEFEYLVIYAKRVAVFFMVICLLRSTKQLNIAIYAIIILTVVLAIQAIYQYNTGIGLAGQPLLKFKNVVGGRATWVGAWDGPNVLCLLFVIAIGLSLEFICKPHNILQKIMNLAFISTMTFGAYLTNSRGGFLGLVAVFFTHIWIKTIRNKKLVIKIFVAVIAGSIIIGGLKFGPSRVSQLDIKEASARERMWLWEQALNKTRENPIVGIGKGQFRIEGHTAAHNNFVQNMVEIGLPGLYVYIALLYLSLKGLLIVIDDPSANKRYPRLSSLSSALFVSMAGYAATTYFVTMELDILFFWFGLCAAAINAARREKNDIQPRFSLKDAGAVFLSVAMVIFTIYLIAVKEIL